MLIFPKNFNLLRVLKNRSIALRVAADTPALYRMGYNMIFGTVVDIITIFY